MSLSLRVLFTDETEKTFWLRPDLPSTQQFWCWDIQGDSLLLHYHPRPSVSRLVIPLAGVRLYQIIDTEEPRAEDNAASLYFQYVQPADDDAESPEPVAASDGPSAGHTARVQQLLAEGWDHAGAEYLAHTEDILSGDCCHDDAESPPSASKSYACHDCPEESFDSIAKLMGHYAACHSPVEFLS